MKKGTGKEYLDQANMNYTVVLGVDAKHLEQLRLVLPTWKKHKPSLFKQPFVIFYDKDEVDAGQVIDVFLGYPFSISLVPWPPDGAEYEGDKSSKWTNSQRYKMLAGFVHVPAKHVKTDFWLKLDTDTVATGFDDWIDPDWYNPTYAIVSQKWHYTKPPMQLVQLEDWVQDNADEHWFLETLASADKLNLLPEEGASRIRHPRIISWCAFFQRAFTQRVSEAVETVCGRGKLPIMSQDGLMWYCAKRLESPGMEILRTNMKSRGWKHRSSMKGIKEAVKEAT